MLNGSQVKRKRSELGAERMARLVSPTSMEGDEFDDSEAQGKSAQGLDGQDPEEMDEDHRERMALKRHASTGNLRVQPRISAMTAISPEQHLYQRQGDDSGDQYRHHSRDSSAATPSPAARENEVGGHFRWGSSEATSVQGRPSPPSGSASPANRSGSNRLRRPNGVVSSPITTVGLGPSSIVTGSSPAMPPPQSPSTPSSAKKTTVQFSEVVEYAQQLQIKYGQRCREHRWGCVELSEDVHLELTIKMYMDWAGLVASGRLSMDELPDLPEFRRPGDSSSSASGTLKRIISTPLTTSFSFSSTPVPRQEAQSPSSTTWPALKSEDQGSFTFGRQNEPRSPSLSPSATSPREGYISDSLMSRIGSPPQHMIPSPPTATTKYHSSSKSSARARKMASSPSLGQHSSFQRFGFSPDSGTPPPPVPPLPAMLSIHQQQQQQRHEDRLSDSGSGINESSYPRRSEEEMEVSGDDEVEMGRASRRPRRHGSGDFREAGREGGEMDLDDEEMYGRATQESSSSSSYHRSLDSHRSRDHHHHHHHHHGHGRGIIRSGHDLDEDEDERDAFLMSGDVVPEKEAQRKMMHVSRTTTRYRPRERFEYDHDNGDDNLIIHGEEQEVGDVDRYAQQQQQQQHQGRGRDLDQAGGGRMGVKAPQSPPSFSKSSSYLGSNHSSSFDEDHGAINRSKNKFNPAGEEEGANGPLKINEDPIEAAGITMVPNFEPRTRLPKQRLWGLDESQCQDKTSLDVDHIGGASPEDSAMIEK